MYRVHQFALLVIPLVLGACTAPEIKFTDGPNCPGDKPKIVKIKIDYTKDPIKVTPPKAVAREGDVLRFNLKGADNKRVSTFGKKSVGGWLNGSGKMKKDKPKTDRFFVCVPTDLFEEEKEDVDEKEFGYNVDAEGRKQLDPVVTVRRL